MTAYNNYGTITGPIVMIGFGSIGRGTLPLILRHFSFDKDRLYVVEPNADNKALAEQMGAKFIQSAITPDNYKSVLDPLFTCTDGEQPFCVNLSVDVCSVTMMDYCAGKNILYIDTVIEAWQGFYFDESLTLGQRTNYTLREKMLAFKRSLPENAPTLVSCCGANPGMVSWFVKQALINLAKDQKIDAAPQTRQEWAQLMNRLGVKGVHVAERDTQQSSNPKPLGHFVNSWSVDGFISEGLQPAELGWGTHEKWMPANAHTHDTGDKAAIYLGQPGGNCRVRTWCPTPGAQYGLLVTHNEAISIPDYFTIKDENGEPTYRPTCHYAYHPCNDALLSMYELFGSDGKVQATQHVLTPEETHDDGIDELGVLLYGGPWNAYWYGSRLSMRETRTLAPHQNATGLQVTSAVLAGMAWALANPTSGAVETDEMDYKFCLDVQGQYLGPVEGHFTDWTPLEGRQKAASLFDEDMDLTDPWQFKNIYVG